MHTYLLGKGDNLMTKALSKKDWSWIWDSFNTWHDSLKQKCETCHRYETVRGEWEDQKKEIESLVENVLQNKYDFV